MDVVDGIDWIALPCYPPHNTFGRVIQGRRPVFKSGPAEEIIEC